MGIFKKNKHNVVEEVSSFDNDADDFDINETSTDVTREDFHKKAEEVLQEAVATGEIEIAEPDDAAANEATSDDANDTDSDGDGNTTDDSQADEDNVMPEDELLQSDTSEQKDEATDDSITEDVNEFAEGDDFDDFFIEDPKQKQSDTEQQDQASAQEDVQKPEKEKKPRMTFAEFREKYPNIIKTAIIVLSCFFAVCLGLYIYGCATIPEGVMGRNMYIEDINVSGLTYDEALAKVKETALLDDYDITIVCNRKSYTINGVDIGLTARVEDTVAKAMEHGKSGNVLADGFANALQIVFKHNVIPSANVNEQTLRTKLAEFGNIVYGELVQHKLEVGDDKIICTPGRTGFSGNTDEAYKEVLEALENEKFKKIKVSLKAVAPKTLTEKDIDAFTYTDPQDARFEIADNTVTVVPEVWGRYLKMDEVKKYVPEIKEGGDVVYIPYYTTPPSVTAETLNAKLFNTELGSFFTYYGGSTANRAANVANAASKINEKVLAPGEVFSFNDTVGKRSIANGFYQAPEYANGQTVMGIGGGTCQVSSTLYNAVLYADLSVVSRLNHMFTVGYCEAGQDATVSDSGVDFKFANNTEYPIKISAVTSGGKITVSILGTERDVKHTVKIQNYSSYSGGNRSVRTYRLVYDPDGNQIRKEEMPKSYYMAHQ